MQEPDSSIPPQRLLASAPAGCGHGDPGSTHTKPNARSQEVGSPCPPGPCCHQRRAGWVIPAPPPGPCPGWENLRPGVMPETDRFAASFIQAELTGKGQAGNQAYDQVSDWKRWDRSRAVKCSSASEGDRPPSSCNTICKASDTAAGICLAFLEERVGGMTRGRAGKLGTHLQPQCSGKAAHQRGSSPCGRTHRPPDAAAAAGQWEPASPCNTGCLALNK